MAVVRRVPVGLGKHLDGTPKAEGADEQCLCFHAVAVLVAQPFNQVEAAQKAVDAQDRVEEVPVDAAHVRGPTDGLPVVNRLEVVVGQRLVGVVSAEFVHQLNVSVVEVGQHVVTRHEQGLQILGGLQGVLRQDVLVGVDFKPAAGGKEKNQSQQGREKVMSVLHGNQKLAAMEKMTERSCGAVK